MKQTKSHFVPLLSERVTHVLLSAPWRTYTLCGWLKRGVHGLFGRQAAGGEGRQKALEDERWGRRVHLRCFRHQRLQRLRGVWTCVCVCVCVLCALFIVGVCVCVCVCVYVCVCVCFVCIIYVLCVCVCVLYVHIYVTSSHKTSLNSWLA